MDLLITVKQWIDIFPPQIATAIIAMIPIAELRGSIPIAIEAYHLPAWQAFVFSVIGNCVPFILLSYIIEPISVWCANHSKILARFLEWIFERTRRKFSGSHARYGAIALMIFVGIPLPLTGAWTGAVAAWLFGISKRLSIPFIIFGILIAAIIVTIMTLGVGTIIRWII